MNIFNRKKLSNVIDLLYDNMWFKKFTFENINNSSSTY
jgi:hypothetical protein